MGLKRQAMDMCLKQMVESGVIFHTYKTRKGSRKKELRYFPADQTIPIHLASNSAKVLWAIFVAQKPIRTHEIIQHPSLKKSLSRPQAYAHLSDLMNSHPGLLKRSKDGLGKGRQSYSYWIEDRELAVAILKQEHVKGQLPLSGKCQYQKKILLGAIGKGGITTDKLLIQWQAHTSLAQQTMGIRLNELVDEGLIFYTHQGMKKRYFPAHASAPIHLATDQAKVLWGLTKAEKPLARTEIVAEPALKGSLSLSSSYTQLIKLDRQHPGLLGQKQDWSGTRPDGGGNPPRRYWVKDRKLAIEVLKQEHVEVPSCQ
jgi:predicted transcriptional regulator